jgi:superoxide reductase
VDVKEKGEIFRCNVCGNEVKVMSVGGGTLICCNKPMEMIKEGEPVEEEEIELEDKKEEENWGGFREEESENEENVEGDINKGFAG